MQTRKLGDTDLSLTTVGFGAWAAGGPWAYGWGRQDDDDSIAAIQHAIAVGVNWIDTAAIYGHGHSEEVVGRAIKGRRDAVTIATKCSLVWNENRKIGNSLKADSVRRECEDSLRRLDIDVIDLYQVHWPNDDDYIEEGWETIAKLIEEGKVRYAGLSNFNVEQIKRCQAIAPVASLQPPYNMLRREVEDELLEFCAANEIGVVVYSPMGGGMLAGKWTADRTASLEDGDWRKKNPDFNPPKLEQRLALVEQLRGIADANGKTVGQLAIAWVLRRPELTSAIVGARRPEQIAETAQAGEWELTAAELDQIEGFLAELD